MAETYTVAVAPHGNNSTTVGLAASLQIAALTPNFLIAEYSLEFGARPDEIARGPLRSTNGAIAAAHRARASVSTSTRRPSPAIRAEPPHPGQSASPGRSPSPGRAYS